MKRRNADCGKLRRPVKRNKITEGMYGSNTLLYMKFLILWAMVITADFMLEFRFEFLWPFWLLLRSVHDSFKYKGLAFSVLFVCIAITSDLVCLFFIPVHWLFFAASTYVWVQYVWHTDKGICLPTIILWMLFVYLEAAIRWKDSRHMPHLDLCRPFAAHCIGYPVVTLGFGFKSYVGYRIRQRKQREVAKENEFYMQLLQQALPQEDSTGTAQSDDASTSPVSNSTTDHIINHSMSDHLQKDLPSTQLSPIHNNHQHHQHHHHSNHHKTAQNSSKSLNISANAPTSGTSVCTASTSPTANTTTTISTPNGHAHHASSNGGVAQSTHKSNRRSMDKERSTGGVDGKSTELSNSRNHSAYQQQQPSYTKDSSSKTSVNASEQSCSASALTATSSLLFASPSSSSSSLSSMSSKGGPVPVSDNRESTSARHSDKDKQNGAYEYHQHTNNVTSKSVDHKGNGQTNSGGSGGNKSNNSNADGPSQSVVSNSNSSSSHNKQNIYTEVNADTASGAGKSSVKSNHNGGVLNVDNDCNNHHQHTTETPEFIEKVKGRRNRVKQQKDTTASTSPKDNHHNHSSSSNHNNNNNNNNTSITSSNTSSSNHQPSPDDHCTAAANYSPVCSTCSQLEGDLKKYKLEAGQYKQIENELRQKSEACVTAKSNLLAKNKENEELDKKIQELQATRQSDRQSIQATERRLTEERRKIDSLSAQLTNERKHRKQLEEKVARTECFESCKARKVQMEADCKQLRRELAAADDSKKSVDQQNRNYEQELRKYEAEFRNREARESTEVLMSALAALQDKNSTLEKNLSAETRVKLDLFSALGDAKRQLEVDKNMLYGKDKEILELRAKIAQLLAVMPSNDSFGMSSSGGSSMLRLADGSQLHQIGPASPMSSHKSLGGSPLISQLQSLGVFTSVSSAPQPSVVSQQQAAVAAQQQAAVAAQQQAAAAHHHHHQQQIQQQQHQQQQQHLAQQQASNLDPNATVYTPKNLVGGAEA